MALKQLTIYGLIATSIIVGIALSPTEQLQPIPAVEELKFGAAFALTDQFDTYSDGDLTGNNGGTGWSGAWSGSTLFDIQGTTVFAGAKAVRVVNDGGGEDGVERSFTSSVDSGDAYYALRWDSGTSGYGTLEFYNGSSFGGGIQIRDDGSPKRIVALSSVAPTELLSNPSSGTWYIVHIQFLSATTFRARVKASGGAFGSFSSTLTYAGSVSSLTKFKFTTGNSSGTTFYWDEICTADPSSSCTGAAAAPVETGYTILFE